ncbi:STAS domain-containing protein [Thetidibacter halocola]|uniref:Anti-sigma factor antagonist n=1 Tax=Thetidibacter halocola TaxID=2827239 RepID=A0A8J8B8U3_9RHOB|nr:STAS domain-containing protein [Thetidibacter halocola]MBS0125134.1 STAS domain-containing protein [Thetidibacter halocola]
MLTTRQDTRAAIVTVDVDRIDAAVAIEFKDQMRAAIADSDGRVVLDLSRVGFVDSSGLGAIVAAMKLMPTGRKLELAGLTENVDKVFRMTRMDSIFTIHRTIDTAVPNA